MAKHLHSLFLGLFLLLLSVPAAIGQTHLRISGSFQNQSLPTILDRLRDEYKLIFAYDVELVSEIHIKKEIRSLTLEDAMRTLLEDSSSNQAMSEALARWHTPDAAARIAGHILAAGKAP